MAKHQEGQKWPEAKRVEVVTTYLVMGKASLVEAVTGVPAGTVRQWKTQPWWNELVVQIQSESDQELDAKLADKVSKALDIVNDRLANGDFIYNPQTGEFVRKPVGLRDTWKVANEMIDKRMLIRKQPKELQSQEAVSDILKNLAKEFASMVKQRINHDGQGSQGLQEGVPELSGVGEAEAQPGPTEQGT